MLPNFVKLFYLQIICLIHSFFYETICLQPLKDTSTFFSPSGLIKSGLGTIGTRYSAPLNFAYGNSTYLKHCLEHKIRYYLVQYIVYTECLAYIRQCCYSHIYWIYLHIHNGRKLKLVHTLVSCFLPPFICFNTLRGERILFEIVDRM